MALGQGQYLPILAVAAGVAVHLCVFKYGEWHLHGPHIIAAHLALGSVTLCYLSGFGDALTGVLGRLAVLAVAYLGGLFSSMTIYRLYFHRLSSFHGPRPAAISKLWHVWHVRDSTNFRFQEKIHKKYGNVVRTGELIQSFHHSLDDGNAPASQRFIPGRSQAIEHPELSCASLSPIKVPMRSPSSVLRPTSCSTASATRRPGMSGTTSSGPGPRPSSPATSWSTRKGASSGRRGCRVKVSSEFRFSSLRCLSSCVVRSS